MLHNNYRSHNRIGPYHFWGISPRNSTLFTRPFLAGRLGTRLSHHLPRMQQTNQNHGKYSNCHFSNCHFGTQYKKCFGTDHVEKAYKKIPPWGSDCAYLNTPSALMPEFQCLSGKSIWLALRRPMFKFWLNPFHRGCMLYSFTLSNLILQWLLAGRFVLQKRCLKPPTKAATWSASNQGKK